jgi:hypothetical protein
MRDWLTTLMEIAGAMLIATGLGMVAVPLGLIFAGASLVAAGWLVAK